MESGEIFRSSSYSEVLGKYGKPASVFAVAPKHAAHATAGAKPASRATAPLA